MLLEELGTMGAASRNVSLKTRVCTLAIALFLGSSCLAGRAMATAAGSKDPAADRAQSERLVEGADKP